MLCRARSAISSQTLAPHAQERHHAHDRRADEARAKPVRAAHRDTDPATPPMPCADPAAPDWPGDVGPRTLRPRTMMRDQADERVPLPCGSLSVERQALTRLRVIQRTAEAAIRDSM